MPPETAAEIGRAAIAAALARAGKRSTTAAVAAAIVPLALAVTMPSASATVTVTGTVTPNGQTAGVFNYQYSFSSTEGQTNVTRIELPEVQANEFLTNGQGGYLGFVTPGWTVSQQSTSAFGGSGANFKSPNNALKPADFIEITYSGGEGLGNGTGQTFTLESYIGGTIASNAVVGGEGFITSVDPPTPGAAPEPGTLALFGSALAGLVGFRRRKA